MKCKCHNLASGHRFTESLSCDVCDITFTEHNRSPVPCDGGRKQFANQHQSYEEKNNEQES